jgi:acid phosphatase
MRKSWTIAVGCAATALAVGSAVTGPAVAGSSSGPRPRAEQAVHGLPGGYKHLVVIYEENHSFDNLYGGWGKVHGQRVHGLSQATPQKRTQVTQHGKAYGCLLQNDVNLASPPLSGWCADSHTPNGSLPGTKGFRSHFANGPFSIDRYIHPQDTTCPKPGVQPSQPNGVPKGAGDPGGCTRDLVHRFYQEQYQINHGLQNRYVTGSDAVGLTMGHYRTRSLPIYRYLHTSGAPKYVIADRFFQAAFGGSFLNHQWLIAARSPVDTSAGPGGTHADLHSVVDAKGFPNASYPLYTPKPEGTKVNDAQLTQACGASANPEVACGDYAVNTIQPSSPPFAAGQKQLPLIDDTKYPNIGDRLSARGISWSWYSGGWHAAASGTPGPLFQYHHQPFNYFANYAPGQPGRRHLKDEKRFIRAAKHGRLPTVSFVKPYGAENEHPGYASEPTGSDHLVDLLKTITSGPQARSTLVVVTYDEFGGQWDHVSPPGAGARRGTHDEMGPGTRIPALVLSSRFRRSGVDHTSYDTTSILASIEHGLGLKPLSTRDASVNDLRHAVAIGSRR